MKSAGTAVVPQAGSIVRQEFGSTQMEVRGETAAHAAAAAQEALVKARCALAKHSPRDIEVVRTRLLKDCARPLFAEKAIYSKPVGSKLNKKTDEWEEEYAEGPSVRLAEAVFRHLGNLYVDAMVVVDDAEKRIIKVMAMDLETNATDAQDVTISKTVERSNAKGRQVISERLNSWGKKTFTVVATEDELLNKVNSGVAKMRRNKIIELAPVDIVEEAMIKCRETTAKTDAQDPDAAKRRLIDAFAEHQVFADDLRAWLGHELEKMTPGEIAQLRKVYAALESEETTWPAVMDARGVKPPAAVSAPQAPTTPAAPAASPPAAVASPPASKAAETPAAQPEPTPAPQPQAQPGGAAGEIVAKLEAGFADAKVPGDLTKLVKLISGLPEDLRAVWRGKYNTRSQELSVR